MLQQYRKPFKVEDVRRWSKMAIKAGVRFGLQLLFGGPGECEMTVNETLALLPELDFFRSSCTASEFVSIPVLQHRSLRLEKGFCRKTTPCSSRDSMSPNSWI